MATGRRRGRAFIYIALILILLLVLVFAATRFMGGGIPGLTPEKEKVTTVLEPTPVVAQDTVDIVVTTQNIRRGQELSEGLVQVVSIAREEYTDGVFYNTVEDVVGARAKYDLTAHTPLTSAIVVEKDSTGSVPSFEIPKGMVAISIPVSRLSSVSYGLQKGDHVNVIASLLVVDVDSNWQTQLPNKTGFVVAPGPVDEGQTNITALLSSNDPAITYLGRIEIDPTMNNPVYILPAETQRPRLVSQTLIQDVVVLQMGNFIAESAPAPAAEEAEPTPVGQEGEVVPPAPTALVSDVATLIVSPQDAVTLNYLMLSDANLNLVMRSAGDDQRIDTEAVTLQFVFDQYRIPVPAKLPYSTNPRVDSSPSSILSFPDPGTRSTATPPPPE
jgi:pilus assembly protein CpaB